MERATPAAAVSVASGSRASGRERWATASSRIITIQYLRAIAASLIVLHHALSVPPLAPYYVRPFGSYGVDLFFVISGYIMWSTTAQGPGGTSRFWTARIARIVPLYWIFTTLYIAVALFVPGALFNASLDVIHVLKSYLFIPAEHPTVGLILPVYTLGWTLNYEMFFYFVFGLCLLIASKPWRLTILVASLALLVSAGWAVHPDGAVAQTYTNPLLLEFAAGVVLARMAGRLQGAPLAVGWSLIGGALCWLLAAYMREALPSLIVAHAIPAIATLAGALVLEPWARRHPILLGVFLGDASYSLYLAHPFAQRAWYLALDKSIGTTSPVSPIFLVVSMIVVGMVGGAVAYLLVEKPIVRAGRRLGRITR